MADQHRGRSRRGNRGSSRGKPYKGEGGSYDGGNRRSRGRPLPTSSRHESSYYHYNSNYDYTSEVNGNSGHHDASSREQRSTRVWWKPFSREQLPSAFLPRPCEPCGIDLMDPWSVAKHLCSMDHCVRVVETERNIARAGGNEKQPRTLRCEFCLSDMRNLNNAKLHFGSQKHRNVFRVLKKDLYNAGFSVDHTERSSSACHSSRTGSRTTSLEEEIPSDRRDDREQHDRSSGRTSSNGTSRPSRWKSPDQPTDSSAIKSEENAGRSEDDSRKHQYFLSSEEEASGSERPRTSSRDRTPDTRTDPKPKVPALNAKSLVDKRKDIISKLSVCTDVRDLTKQLRQISKGSDDRNKTARKVLPGVAYSDREIEQQETFAEARAQRLQAITQQDEPSSPIVSEKPKTPNKDIESVPRKGTIKTEVHVVDADDDEEEEQEQKHEEDCTVVPAPEQPAPQQISDSDSEEEQLPPAKAKPQQHPSSNQVETVTAATIPTSNFNSVESLDFGKLAVVVAQEAAVAEKLRYLSMSLPNVENLLLQMKQEHQNCVAQFELLQAAKRTLIAGVSQGPVAPAGAEQFNSRAILNTILQSATSTNISWLLGNPAPSFGSNIQEILQNLTVPSPPLSYALVTNGSPSPGTSGIKNGRDRKRAAANDESTPESVNSNKKPKSGDFREQLHSETILVVRLLGNSVYTSSEDGIVKRTPISDEGRNVVLYKHCGQDSNSKLKKVCAHVLEVSVHKKMNNIKLITGSDDCALRVFDGDTGHLMKVVPVQARVLCGVIHWQKIYVGLKNGFVQVYNLIDQRFLVESESKQVPKLIAPLETGHSKALVVLTEDDSIFLRDAGTLFVLQASKLCFNVINLVVKVSDIVLVGKLTILVLDNTLKTVQVFGADSSAGQEHENLCAISFRNTLLVSLSGGLVRTYMWSDQTNRTHAFQKRKLFSYTSECSAVATSFDGSDEHKRIAIATATGTVIITEVDLQDSVTTQS